MDVNYENKSNIFSIFHFKEGFEIMILYKTKRRNRLIASFREKK